MKHNVFSSIVAFVCAALGIMFSYLLHNFINSSGSGFFPLATRIVVFIGPLGWLLLSLGTASFIVRFRGSRPGSILAVCFLLAMIAAESIILFTPVYYDLQSVARPSANKSLQPTRGGDLGSSRSRGLFYIAVTTWLS
jgi:hypothetical protein